MPSTDAGSSDSSGPPASRNAVQRVLHHLNDSIVRGGLMPGEHIRQNQLAEELGVSRVPVREALKVLSAQGIVLYEENRGYFAGKLGVHDMSQVYLMRRLLETELLHSLAWPSQDQLDELIAINKLMALAAAEGDISEMVALNRRFHFDIFSLSPMQLVLAEVRRLWTISDAYRALYLNSESSRLRITDEHEDLLQALATKDREGCIGIMDAHRSAAEVSVKGMLSLRSS